MPAKAATLSNNARLILSALARLRFATREQLLYWSPLGDLSSITRLTNKLFKDGWIHYYDELRPRVFRLTQTGRRVMAAPSFGRRFSSMSAIQQHCHKNNSEILLRKTNPEATFQTRKFSLSYGLNPSVAEYLVLMKEGEFALALVDDYFMASERVKHSLERTHTPDKRFYSFTDSHVVRHWFDAVKQVFVFSTDEVQVEKHQSFINENNLTGKAEFIQPIWNVS